MKYLGAAVTRDEWIDDVLTADLPHDVKRLAVELRQYLPESMDAPPSKEAVEELAATHLRDEDLPANLSHNPTLSK